MTASESVRSMATDEAHNRKIIDVKISFWFSEKPSAALLEDVKSFIIPRAQKSIFHYASDTSTQAGITILLRTETYKSKGVVASTLRSRYKSQTENVTIIVDHCNEIEKASLGKIECPSIERTDAARPSCLQDISIRERNDIGSCASKNGSVASQVNLKSQDIGRGVSQSIGSSALSKSIIANAVKISFRLESFKADMPAEALLQSIQTKASEAVIDVTSTGESGIEVKIQCVWKNNMYPNTVRRLIIEVCPKSKNIIINTIDKETVRAAYNNTPLHNAGRRWLQFSLDKCAAYDMTLSELASGLRVSAVDEQKRYLDCITRKEFKADALRKLLLIINLSDAISKKCSDSHAHGPSTNAPPAASTPCRTLVFSPEAGAAASCAVPTNRGLVPNSSDAASAGMIMTSLILTPRCRADSCAGLVFGQNLPRCRMVRKKAVHGWNSPTSGTAKSQINALLAQRSPLQKRIALCGVWTVARPFQHPRLLMQGVCLRLESV